MVNSMKAWFVFFLRKYEYSEREMHMRNFVMINEKNLF